MLEKGGGQERALEFARLVHASSRRAQGFANAIRDAMKEAGWSVRGPISAAKDMAVVDVQVSVAQKYFGSQKPEPFLTLRDTMEFLGIRCRRLLVTDPSSSPLSR
jgi:hypothetical protein